MVFIRNAYRIPELSGGWNSYVMRTEWSLIVFDMVPMAVAVGAFVIFSPSVFSGEHEGEVKKAQFSDNIPILWIHNRAV